MSLTRKQKMAAGGGVVALGVLAVALGGRDDVEIQPIGGGGGGGAGTSDLPIFNDGGSKKESVPTTIINYPEMTPYVSETPDFSTFFTSDSGSTSGSTGRTGGKKDPQMTYQSYIMKYGTSGNPQLDMMRAYGMIGRGGSKKKGVKGETISSSGFFETGFTPNRTKVRDAAIRQNITPWGRFLGHGTKSSKKDALSTGIFPGYRATKWIYGQR